MIALPISSLPGIVCFFMSYASSYIFFYKIYRKKYISFSKKKNNRKNDNIIRKTNKTIATEQKQVQTRDTICIEQPVFSLHF